MNTLRSDFLVFRQSNSSRKRVLGAFRMGADHAEIVAAPADLHIEARLEQTQILIQRAAQIREPRVVGRLEIEFALRALRSSLGRPLEFSGQQPAAQRVRTELP